MSVIINKDTEKRKTIPVWPQFRLFPYDVNLTFSFPPRLCVVGAIHCSIRYMDDTDEDIPLLRDEEDEDEEEEEEGGGTPDETLTPAILYNELDRLKSYMERRLEANARHHERVTFELFMMLVCFFGALCCLFICSRLVYMSENADQQREILTEFMQMVFLVPLRLVLTPLSLPLTVLDVTVNGGTMHTSSVAEIIERQIMGLFDVSMYRSHKKCTV